MGERLLCPVCLTSWSAPLRTRGGEKCMDMSKGQVAACAGRLIPEPEFLAAEWVRPREVEAAEDPRSRIRVD